MHAPIFGPVLCVCGWRGVLRAQAPCPACRRLFGDRVTPKRLALLRAFHANSMAPRNRCALASAVRLGLLRAYGPPPAGSDVKRRKAPLRPYTLTLAGRRVLEVADEIVAEQTRHDVAAAAARHADLEEK